MATKKQYPDNIPAFSNQDIYELIHGKKPPRKVNKRWRKLSKLLFGSSSDDTWTGSKIWNFVGGLSFFLTLIPFLLVWENVSALRQNMFPLQLGGASFFTLFILSKMDRETTLFKISGLLAIVMAVAIPVMALNLLANWQAAISFLPAHLAVCGMAALYRSDENLDVIYIIQKAFSYLVFTFLTGWLSLYALTNI